MRLIKTFAAALLSALCGFVSLNAQNREVSGTVLDTQQQAVIGATVMVVGGAAKELSLMPRVVSL